MTFSENSDNIKKISINPSPGVIKSLLYVCEVGNGIFEGAVSSELHKSDSFLIVLVHSGEVILKCDDLEYSVHEGQCIFIDCRKKYTFKSGLDKRMEILWLNFCGFAAEYFFREFMKNNRFIFCPNSFEVIENTIREMILVNSCGSDVNEILNNKYITDILTQIITEYCITETKEDTVGVINSVRNYIDMHFVEDISLDMLAEGFYISKYYLAKEFKKSFGITVFQYITEKRMELAKHLLLHTNNTVEDISEQCGFHDQSYFVRQFKKREGMTCLCYRKSAGTV